MMNLMIIYRIPDFCILKNVSLSNFISQRQSASILEMTGDHLFQSMEFCRFKRLHAPVIKFRETASNRDKQNALNKSTIPCNEIHSLKMPPFITDKLFLCRQLRHDRLPLQECHTCTAGRKTKERVQTGKSRETSMGIRCFAFVSNSAPVMDQINIIPSLHKL